MTKKDIFMTPDLERVFEALIRAARHASNSQVSSVFNRPTMDLATVAVAFTIQLAIAAGQDPVEMRSLERDLIALMA